MSLSEDGGKWSILLLLGSLQLFFPFWFLCFFSHLTFLCSTLWANIPSKTHLFVGVLNLSLSFLFMKTGPSVSSCLLYVASVSLSWFLLAWVQTSSNGLRWAHYLFMQSHPLFLLLCLGQRQCNLVFLSHLSVYLCANQDAGEVMLW